MTTDNRFACFGGAMTKTLHTEARADLKRAVEGLR